MDILQATPLTLSLVKAAVVAGTTSTLSNTGAINYAIRGKAYTRAALSNTAAPTVDATTGLAFAPILPNTGAVIVIGVNAAGTLVACQGAAQALDVAGNFIAAPQFPMVVDNFCPIAYEVIKAGATASALGFVFGTSNQSGVTGITYALQDIISLPDRPQVA